MSYETQPAIAPRWSSLDWLLYAVTTIAVSLFLGCYLFVAVQRMAYPYELEWMEGGSVDQVSRLLAGEKLYVEPTPSFVPYIYTPLYYYVAAGVAKLTGPGFFALRLVSFLASLVCFVVVARFAYRETRCRNAALLAAGLFASTYAVSGRWFDLGRVDSLFLMWLLLGCYVAKYWSSWPGAMLAGILLALSFLTKQTALVVTAAVCFGVVVRRPTRGLIIGGTFAATIAITTLWLNVVHQGWYVYYVFELPRQHAIAKEFLSDFWLSDVVAVAGTFMVGVVYLLVRIFRTKSAPQTEQTAIARDAAWFDFYFWGAMLLAAWLSRLHSGGYDNVLFPLYAAIAIAAACGLHALRTAQFSAQRSWRALVCLVLLGTLLQLWFLRYDPRAQIPGAAHRHAWDELVTRIRNIDGPVVVPYHGHIGPLSGNAMYSQQMAAVDILRSHESPIRSRLKQQFEDSLRRQEFAAIVLDVRQWHQATLERYYVHVGTPLDNPDAMRGLTGDQSYRPWRMYVPRR